MIVEIWEGYTKIITYVWGKSINVRNGYQTLYMIVEKINGRGKNIRNFSNVTTSIINRACYVGNKILYERNRNEIKKTTQSHGIH